MNDVLVFDNPLSPGLKFRLLRTSHRLTQSETAELCGVAQIDVSLYERNKPIRPEVRVKIETFFENLSKEAGNA